MRADFLDVSEPNIHPVWETTVLLWISKLPWLKQRVPPNFEQATRESLAAYFKTKPWARRAHPSIVAQGEEAEEVRRLRHARCVELTTSDARLHARSMHSDHAATHPPIIHPSHPSPTLPLSLSALGTLTYSYRRYPNPN